MGIYLSAHPLDEYKIVLDNLCNTQCDELADVNQLKDREDVISGGIVTAVRSKFAKSGKPCGFVTLEDFNGSGELALFGEDWGRWNGMFTEGPPSIVTGKVQPRFQYSDIMQLKVQNIEYLQTVKDKAIDRITISLTTDLLNDQIVADLSEIIATSIPARPSSSSSCATRWASTTCCCARNGTWSTCAISSSTISSSGRPGL